jgi:hypothetical protein
MARQTGPEHRQQRYCRATVRRQESCFPCSLAQGIAPLATMRKVKAARAPQAPHLRAPLDKAQSKLTMLVDVDACVKTAYCCECLAPYGLIAARGRSPEHAAIGGLVQRGHLHCVKKPWNGARIHARFCANSHFLESMTHLSTGYAQAITLGWRHYFDSFRVTGEWDAGLRILQASRAAEVPRLSSRNKRIPRVGVRGAMTLQEIGCRKRVAVHEQKDFAFRDRRASIRRRGATLGLVVPH